jgi:hypothetical protein
MFPPDLSYVVKLKPVTNAVERGLRNPAIEKDTSVPPGMSLAARLETVSTPLEKEH